MNILQPKHSGDPYDLRVILAEYILNFEFPRDVFMLLITIFTVYLMLKLFRFAIRALASIIRPVIFIILILVSCFFIPRNSMSTIISHFGFLSDHSTILLRDEIWWHRIKSPGVECSIFRPEYFPNIQFHLYAHHPILCQTILDLKTIKSVDNGIVNCV